jgi:hypothetical protein
MQKMQAAAGGKPLGPNGQPSPAQIEAMRVSRRGVAPYLGEGFSLFVYPWRLVYARRPSFSIPLCFPVREANHRSIKSSDLIGSTVIASIALLVRNWKQKRLSHPPRTPLISLAESNATRDDAQAPSGRPTGRPKDVGGHDGRCWWCRCGGTGGNGHGEYDEEYDGWRWGWGDAGYGADAR